MRNISKNKLSFESQIENILDRTDTRKIMIAGPCSLHDPRANFEFAQKAKKLSQMVEDEFLIIMRGYPEKPRTTVGWKGLMYDPDLDATYDFEKGIIETRKLLLEIAELGVPVGSEFLNVLFPQYIV